MNILWLQKQRPVTEPQLKIFNFLQNDYYGFDEIVLIYGDCPPNNTE
jgi:hypothetical protein